MAGAQAVVSLRGLTHTDARWDQFWRKLDQYGFDLAASIHHIESPPHVPTTLANLHCQ